MNALKKFVKSFFRNQWSESVIIFFSSVPVLRRFFFLLRPRHTDYEPGTLRNAGRNNINYELDLSDWVEWNIYFCNRVEPREKIYALAQTGDTVIDVGVNIGETLLNLANKVGGKGKVVGFEPALATFNKCRNNIALNPSLKNIALHRLALGRKEEELFIQVKDERNRGESSLSESAVGEKIKVTTLDLFAARENIPRVNLIKIDAEGFEMNVLLGAEQTILRFLPKLFIEVDDNLLKQQKYSAEELVRWLMQRGYKIYNAENNSAVSPGQSFANCHFDIICAA